MFALKNDPYLDCHLFAAKYNRSLLDTFARQWAILRQLGLVAIDGRRVQLTAKGRLCVEEISALFRCRHLSEDSATLATAERPLLEKHNFAPTYAGL
jgi:hypothetical protein